ncbi:hypothetical protein PYCC9005_000719 [Savitreella phatthalungensis]
MVKPVHFRIATALLAALLPFLIPRVQNLMSTLGLRREFAALNLETCKQIHHNVLAGCEDLALHVSGSTRLLYTACAANVEERIPWFPAMGHFSDPELGSRIRDKLFVLDLTTDKLTELKTPNFVSTFVSHGIDVIPTKKDPTVVAIYAINHTPKGSVVEKFYHKVGSAEARHQKTFSSAEYMYSPNDLHVFDESRDAFFYTNDHLFLKGIPRQIETMLQLPTTSLGFHAQGNFKIAARLISNANGVQGDRRGNMVVNSVFSYASLYQYQPDGTVNDVQVIKVKHGIDNPFWSAETKEIFFAGFPRAGELEAFAKDFDRKTAASAVSRVKLESLLPWAPTTEPGEIKKEDIPKPLVDEVFLDPGTGLANMTTAVALDAHRDQLYLTSVFGRALVRCDGFSKWQTVPI